MDAGHAVIAGGGIGGMAAAAALARAGWRVTLFERRHRVAELGAGLQMSPNASRCLMHLGAFEAAEKAGFLPRAAVLRDGFSGSEIFRAPLGAAATERWGAPYLHVHRADLLDALTASALAAGTEIRTGQQVVGWTDDMGWPLVVTSRPAEPAADGGAADEKIEADLIVVADGLRSRLREQIAGAADPRFAGQVAWRALVETERLPESLVAPDATVWAGPGRHVVTYYLRGGRLVNLVAVVETEEWAAEGWAEPGDPDELRAAFAGWHPDVERLLAGVESAMRWGLFLRSAPAAWTRGRAALLGDACHPMLPFMAQGAAMAIEDAVVLARRLGEEGSVREALMAYRAERRPRTDAVQAVSRENGRLYHREDTPMRRIGDFAISMVSQTMPWVAAARFDWLYGHDAVRG
jgi:salicylate hydroxylase